LRLQRRRRQSAHESKKLTSDADRINAIYDDAKSFRRPPQHSSHPLPRDKDVGLLNVAAASVSIAASIAVDKLPLEKLEAAPCKSLHAGDVGVRVAQELKDARLIEDVEEVNKLQKCGEHLVTGMIGGPGKQCIWAKNDRKLVEHRNASSNQLH
jgi:hypothetical protein